MAKKRQQTEAIADPNLGADPLSRLPPQDRKALQRLLKSEKVKDDEWDVIVVGDGSGSKWGYAAGFGSISFERRTRRMRSWFGALNDGTVNLAEIMAYMAPLQYLATQAQDAKEQGTRFKVLNVHIFTDSQYCRDMGNRGCPLQGKNGLLWECLNSVKRVGVITHWHWIRRETNPFNSIADRLSKAARTAIMNV